MFFYLTLARFKTAMETAYVNGFIEAGLYDKTPIGLCEIKKRAKGYVEDTLKKQKFGEDDLTTTNKPTKGDAH